MSLVQILHRHGVYFLLIVHSGGAQWLASVTSTGEVGCPGSSSRLGHAVPSLNVATVADSTLNINSPHTLLDRPVLMPLTYAHAHIHTDTLHRIHILKQF